MQFPFEDVKLTFGPLETVATFSGEFSLDKYGRIDGITFNDCKTWWTRDSIPATSDFSFMLFVWLTEAIAKQYADTLKEALAEAYWERPAAHRVSA